MGGDAGVVARAEGSHHWLWGDKPWVMLTGVVISVGSLAANVATALSDVLFRESENGFLESLAVCLVLGFFIGGFGQFMRSLAHGNSSRVGRRVDGWGKVLGVLGWSIALVGTALSADAGSVLPDWLLLLFMNVPAFLGCFLALWVMKLAADGPR